MSIRKKKEKLSRLGFRGLVRASHFRSAYFFSTKNSHPKKAGRGGRRAVRADRSERVGREGGRCRGKGRGEEGERAERQVKGERCKHIVLGSL